MMTGDLRRFAGTAALFVMIGLVIYAGLYVGSERLAARYAHRNRFHTIKTAPRADYDHVILGASHGAVFDYRDMNGRLEAMTDSSILNLSVEGAGISVNRLILDYFLTEHRTSSVVYVLDSFAFYASDWNEDRWQDASLFQRAPWDPALARLLLARSTTRAALLDYVVGFSKINNPDRFEADLFANERSPFERTYRPVGQIDRQRIGFLYPAGADSRTLPDNRYLRELDDLIRDVRSEGMRLVIVRPPIPARMRAMLPNEDAFDITVAAMVEAHGAELHDFSSVNNEEAFFFDSDHLNQDGVVSFFENHLAAVLTGAPAPQ